jgi:acetyltransferase-like isoleucine patch superfamily enzyme
MTQHHNWGFLKAQSIEPREGLEVGEGTLYNGHIRIKGVSPVKIGKYCAIAENLHIISSSHDYSYPVIQNSFMEKFFGINHEKNPENIEKNKVVIGSDVWFGDNCIVVPGVTIGNGCIIAAGAVVTKDIPDYSVAAGVPAKVLKKRFPDDIIALLLEISWWNWPEEKIKRNKAFFTTNLNSGVTAEDVRKILKD